MITPESIAHHKRWENMMKYQQEVFSYFVSHDKNWLGQLLNTMCDVGVSAFNGNNTIQYRKDVTKAYNEFVTNSLFAQAAKTDPTFGAILSFANLFGSFVEEMNEKTIEGLSVLFQPATADSLENPLTRDSNQLAAKRKSEMMAAYRSNSGSTPSTSRAAAARSAPLLSMVWPEYKDPMQAMAAAMNDPTLSFRMPPRFGPAAIGARVAVERRGEATPRKATAVDEQQRGDQRTPFKRAKKVIAKTPLELVQALNKTPAKVAMTPMKTVPKTPTEILIARGAAARADLSEKMIDCADCGVSVKQGGMRRHQQEHRRERGEERTPNVFNSTLGALSEFTDSDDEPLVKRKSKPSIISPLKKRRSQVGLADSEEDDDVIKVEDDDAMDRKRWRGLGARVAALAARMVASPSPPPATAAANAVEKKEKMDDRERMHQAAAEVAQEKEKEVLDEWATNLLYKEATCFQCNRVCENYHQLSNHLYHNHKGICQGNYIFECLGCNKQFRSYRGAMGHVENAIRKKQLSCKNKVIYLWDVKHEDEDEEEEEEEGEQPGCSKTPAREMLKKKKKGEEEEEENEPSPTL